MNGSCKKLDIIVFSITYLTPTTFPFKVKSGPPEFCAKKRNAQDEKAANSIDDEPSSHILSRSVIL
jgi:hypothetical protein